MYSQPACVFINMCLICIVYPSWIHIEAQIVAIKFTRTKLPLYAEIWRQCPLTKQIVDLAVNFVIRPEAIVLGAQSADT